MFGIEVFDYSHELVNFIFEPGIQEGVRFIHHKVLQLRKENASLLNQSFQSVDRAYQHFHSLLQHFFLHPDGSEVFDAEGGDFRVLVETFLIQYNISRIKI